MCACKETVELRRAVASVGWPLRNMLMEEATAHGADPAEERLPADVLSTEKPPSKLPSIRGRRIRDALFRPILAICEEERIE